MENMKPLDDSRGGVPELKAGAITPAPVTAGTLEYAAGGQASRLPPAMTASPDVMSLFLACAAVGWRRRSWGSCAG